MNRTEKESEERKSLKTKPEELYKNSPDIHVDVSMIRPRVEIKNKCAKLIGVYRHIFQIGSKIASTGTNSIQYGELLTVSVRIA